MSSQGIPDVLSLPVVVVSKDRYDERFTSGAILSTYFSTNPKYVVVPKDQCKAYRAYLQKAHPEFRVLAQPSTGLAAADAFLGSVEFPLDDPSCKFTRPFVLKAVDDLVHIKAVRIDSVGDTCVTECSKDQLWHPHVLLGGKHRFLNRCVPLQNRQKSTLPWFKNQ